MYTFPIVWKELEGATIKTQLNSKQDTRTSHATHLDSETLRTSEREVEVEVVSASLLATSLFLGALARLHQHSTIFQSRLFPRLIITTDIMSLKVEVFLI